MPTPWEKYAAQGSRPWEKYAAPPPPAPTPGAAQHTEDYLKSQEPPQGFFSSAWQATGLPALWEAAKAENERSSKLSLPEQLKEFAVKAVKTPLIVPTGIYDTVTGIPKQIDQAAETVAAQAARGDYPGVAGTMAGTVAPLLLPEVADSGAAAASKVANAAERVRSVATPQVRSALVKVIPKGKEIITFADSVQQALKDASEPKPEVLREAGPVAPYTPKPVVVQDGPRTSSGRLLTPDEIAFEKAGRERRVTEFPDAPSEAAAPERVPGWQSPLARPADIQPGPASREVAPGPPRDRTKPATAEEKVSAATASKPNSGVVWDPKRGHIDLSTGKAPTGEAKVVPIDNPAENKFAAAARGKRAAQVDKIAQMFIDNGFDESGISSITTDVRKAAQLREIAKAAGVGELPKDLKATVRDLQTRVSELKKAAGAK